MDPNPSEESKASTAEPAAAAPAEPMKKPRRAVDEATRERISKRAAVRRRLEDLADARSLEDLDRKIEDMRSRRAGSNASPSPADSATPRQPPPLRPVEERTGPAPAGTSAAAPPPQSDPLDKPEHPGWPSRREVQAISPMVESFWRQSATALAGTRYQIGDPQIGILVEGTAPAAAKYAMPKSCEAAAGLALVLVFGPAAVGHLVELGKKYFGEWRASRRSSTGKVLAAVQ